MLSQNHSEELCDEEVKSLELLCLFEAKADRLGNGELPLL